jgi:EmrB/QacA subfamily drug resistance transporter
MIMLDNTVVNVALPSIQRDLGADLSELEWIVTGYALTFASLMLVGGKVADAYGRRLVFVIGIVVFTFASLMCGFADSSEMLIGARVLQGAGAALMNPATLSIIAATFPPRERGTAIGIWAGTSALALAIGPLVGGLITEHIDWSWIFFVNVPVGVLAIVASLLFIDESRDETHERLDIPGLFTSALALFALTYGLIEANTYGWARADPRLLRAGGALLRRVHRTGEAAARADAPAGAVPEPHLHGGQSRDAPRRARDVRSVLLRLALHAEHPRLLGRADGRRIPADDGPDHPGRTDCREDE